AVAWEGFSTGTRPIVCKPQESRSKEIVRRPRPRAPGFTTSGLHGLQLPVHQNGAAALGTGGGSQGSSCAVARDLQATVAVVALRLRLALGGVCRKQIELSAGERLDHDPGIERQ